MYIYLPGPSGSFILTALLKGYIYAQFLNDASRIKFSQPTWQEHTDAKEDSHKDNIMLQMPIKKLKVAVPLSEFSLK